MIRVVVKGLTRGSHEIKLVTASHDHDALGAEAVVTIRWHDGQGRSDETAW